MAKALEKVPTGSKKVPFMLYVDQTLEYMIDNERMLNCNPATSIGYVGIYSYTRGSWSLQQTLIGSTDSGFGTALAFSSTGTQLAVGVPYYDSQTGM